MPDSPASASHPVHRAFVAACLLLLVLELLSMTAPAVAPHRLIGLDPNRYSPFLGFAVGNVFMTQFVLHGRNAGLATAAAGGLVLFILHCILLQPAWTALTPWLGLLCYCLGLGSLIFLVQRILFGRDAAAPHRPIFVLQAGLLPALFVLLSWSLLESGAHLTTLTLDAPLWRFEASLGLLPSAVCARLFLDHPLLADACLLVYCSLPLAVGLVFARQSRDRQPSAILRRFLLAGIAGSCLYAIYPAAGPRYLLGTAFPWHLPELTSIPLTASRIEPAFLNAMPSLHMAWALLLWFALRSHAAPVRLATGAFAVLTALATLGLGEHYFVDLVVACPLALLVHRLTSPDCARAALIAPTALIAAWLSYLRINTIDFAIVGMWHWIPVIATVVLCLRPGALCACVKAEQTLRSSARR